MAPEASLAHLFGAGLALAFFGGIFMTNQFHKWAHLEEPPAWIAMLQDCRLILSPDHHDVHHTPPFDKYYCITTGWLNRPLAAVQFWARLERLVERVLGARVSA